MKRNIQIVSTGFLILFAIAANVAGVTAQADCDQNSIVGAWRGASGEGNGLVISFITGGNLISSVQSEVTLSPRLSVLTPGHGVWTHLGGCQYGYTVVGLLYTIQTGKSTGYLKAKGVIGLNPNNMNVITGTDKVSIYDAAGNLVFEVPEGQTSLTRTVMEPYN
jgi:hypothetical protein